MMNPNFGMGMQTGMGMGMQSGMGMGMQPGMGMGMQPGMGMGMQGMNMGMMDNEEWLKGFQMGVEEINAANAQEEQLNSGPKINVIFKTTQGTTTAMVYEYGTTIDKALEKYLKRVGRPDLYREKSNKICFLFNAAQLKIGDQIKVENFFKNVQNPKVVVNDVNNLIGA